jgi:hypothetical protein
MACGRLATKVSNVEAELYGWIRERMSAGALTATTGHIRRLLLGTLAGDAIARRKAGPKDARNQDADQS